MTRGVRISKSRKEALRSRKRPTSRVGPGPVKPVKHSSTHSTKTVNYERSLAQKHNIKIGQNPNEKGQYMSPDRNTFSVLGGNKVSEYRQGYIPGREEVWKKAQAKVAKGDQGAIGEPKHWGVITKSPGKYGKHTPHIKKKGGDFFVDPWGGF